MNTPTGNDLQQSIKAIAHAVSECILDNPELISDACHVALKLELKPERVPGVSQAARGSI